MKQVAIALGIALAFPAAAAAGPNPPGSKAYGKSLSEWMVLYMTWALGGDQDDHVGRVRFMPLPVGEAVSGDGSLDDPLVLVGELDVTFRTGQPFVMPVAVWISETYDPDLGIPDDTPIARSVFTGSDVYVTLDGKELIDSEEDDLRKFYFGPEEFDSPIIYEEPTDYGAIGALAVQGLGFAHPPLSKGTHTLRLQSEIRVPELDLHVIFVNEWTITVTR